MTQWHQTFLAHTNIPAAFKRNGMAKLPEQSLIYRVFLRNAFSVHSGIYCDGPANTIRDWTITARMIANPVDFVFDSTNTQLNGRPLSHSQDITQMALVPLWVPKKQALQGRDYIGFQFFTADLIPY